MQVVLSTFKEGESVQAHIKSMTEISEAHSVIGYPVSEEDRVVHLLASLPDSLNTDVPEMEVVTEQLLDEMLSVVVIVSTKITRSGDIGI